MGWWAEHVVPRLVDASLAQDDVMRLRRAAFARVRGRVLELGFGSGLNLPVLPAAVTHLDAVEPSDVAWARSAQRRAAAPFTVRRVGLDGERLDAGDGTYDAVVVAFSLCTIERPDRAVREARRVLVPGGALWFLEHGAAPDAGVARWQRRLDRVQGALFAGCHLTRDAAALCADGGLSVGPLRSTYLGTGPARPWVYVTSGAATR